ncbi:MAG: chemotaxis protein CheW [Mariprofundaceae bacterium]
MTSDDIEDIAEVKPDDQSVQSLLGVEQEDILLIDIGGKRLLVRAADVSEIIRPIPLTQVPMGPEHLLGLANVRGQIVCMIDPSKVMQLPPVGSEATAHTRFILLRHAKMHIGIWVDKVDALFRVNSDDIPAAAEVDASEPGCGSMQIEGETYEMLNCNGLFH